MSEDMKALQRSLNKFTTKYLRGIQPLGIDGQKGSLTNARIKVAKHFLGYGRSDTKVTQEFVRRLRHPRSRKYSSAGLLARAYKRRAAQRARWRRNQTRAYLGRGTTTFDGVPVAKVAVPILTWCRANGWHGHLVSGWRSPAYSDSLCRNMCGAPSCPGKCAGRASNHSGDGPDRFAVDVSDYGTFANVVARCPIKPHIFNALGSRDPVHFSPTGR